MKTWKAYTMAELTEMRQMREQGASLEEIAKMFGRSKGAICEKFSEMGWTKKMERKKKDVADAVVDDKADVPARKPSLSDFQPRDMIKYLYKLGYRIENNKLVFVQKTVISISKIMED